MKVIGIVSEYNPFHNGHKYHIEISKKLTMSDYVVCVMSGNFIQRGEPALMDKWVRAETALLNGVDLVVELPVIYALQSAEKFAFGAIKILDSLGIIDYVSFGSECGNIEELTNIANILIDEPHQISTKIKSLQKKGYTYPKAQGIAIDKYLDKMTASDKGPSIISSPNNVLGIEYIKALIKINSKIIPVTVKRHKADYNSLELNSGIASATAIRNKLLINNSNLEEIKNFVPDKTLEILTREFINGKAPIFTHYFDNIIIGLLRRLTLEEIASFPDISEGLENRIIKMSKKTSSIDELISLVKTKRYTQTRIQRSIFNVLISNTTNILNEFNIFNGPQYIRILGTNEKGRKLLKAAANKATLPIITKTVSYKKSCNPLLKKMMELDIKATDIYSIAYPKKENRIGNLDFYNSPIVL